MSATYGTLDDSDTDSRSNASNKHTSAESTASTVSEDFTSRVIGDFGRWQLQVSILMALLKIPQAWCQLGIVFLAPSQHFWCEKPTSFMQYTDSEWRDICKPRTEELPCLIYDPEVLLSRRMNIQYIQLVECPKFIYDNSTFHSTIISEWDLVCNKRWYVQLSQIILMLGILLGSVAFGIAADKYGRKKPLIVAIIIQSVCSLMSSFSPNYWLFVLNRFAQALAAGGINIICFVICMEVVGGKYRTIIPIVYQIPFGFGNTIMSLVAYYFRSWRQLELTLGILSSMYILYVFYIPESPRWLLARGRTEEAIHVLKKAAAKNKRGVEISKETMKMLKVDKPDSAAPVGFFAFFQYKNMRLKTILLSTTWFLLGMEFYAFSEYMGQIVENVFLMVAVGGIISLPGSIVCIFLVREWGRRMVLVYSHVFTALCFIMLLAIPKDTFFDWPKMIMTGLGLAGMAVSIPTLYLFTGELYPTLGRNVGVGGCSLFARIGSMISPLLVSLDRLGYSLSLITLAVCSVMQAAMVIPLPETKGCPLPDTMEQAERFDKAYSKNYRREKQRRREHKNREKLLK